MRRKNPPPEFSIEKIIYAIVLSIATYYSVLIIIEDL